MKVRVYDKGVITFRIVALMDERKNCEFDVYAANSVSSSAGMRANVGRCG